jgi:peroxiredoxin
MNTPPDHTTTETSTAGRPRRSPKGTRIYALFLASLGLIVLLAWMGQDRIDAVQLGSPAPEFTVTDLDGQEVTLDDYEGKVLLLNVWATWCAPCREEMPSMQALYESFDDRDFEILAISIDTEEGEPDAGGRGGGDVRGFADDFGLTFPILRNPSGDIQTLYLTTGVPESFIVGRDGLIYKRLAGPTDWNADQHRTLIERLITTD